MERNHKPNVRRVLDGFLSEQAFADEIGRAVITLRLWRRKGYGPPFVRVGKTPYYDVEKARHWIAAQERKQSPRSAA